MTTLDFILDLFNQINLEVNPSGTFIWNTRTLAATEYERPTPQVHLYPIRINPGVYDGSTTSVNILMAFWAQDLPDSTPQYKRSKISEMELLARAWLKEIEKSKKVELVENSVVLEPQEKAITGMFIGYAAQFQLKIFEPC